MRKTSTVLPDFISDFHLRTTELGVCFDAVVNFNLPYKSFNLETAVHMESRVSRHFDTIYLLSPLVEKCKMPTFFNDANHQFIYLNRTGLIITGKMPLFGAYSIAMYPKNTERPQQAYNELRGKKLN